MAMPVQLRFTAFIACVIAVFGSSTSQDVPDFYSLPPCSSPTPNWAVVCACGYQQTTDYTCGPSSVMSLLIFNGFLATEDANHVTEMRIASEMGTNDVNGTDSPQMAAWLAALVKPDGTHLYHSVAGVNATVGMLRNYLSKGEPVLVDWIDWGGHWALAVGYLSSPLGPDYDSVYFADPATHFRMPMTNNPCGITGMNAQRLQAMWFDSSRVRGVHVLATPLVSGLD